MVASGRNKVVGGGVECVEEESRIVDERHSSLVELSALSAGKTLVVDGLTEHLEMPILFLAFNFNFQLGLAWILGFCTLISHNTTIKLVTLLASLAAVTTSAFSPISTATELQSFSRYAASVSNSQLFAMTISVSSSRQKLRKIVWTNSSI
eukprot:scaffold10997_cov61-Skeletonema_dohrnii-CCMP3373.AAC.1